MKIIVDRVSVSAGDDIVPHKTEYEVSEKMTVGAFFAFLEEEQCLDRLVKEYRDGEWFEEISNYINNVITSV